MLRTFWRSRSAAAHCAARENDGDGALVWAASITGAARAGSGSAGGVCGARASTWRTGGGATGGGDTGRA